MPNPPSATRRTRRPASPIAAAFAIVIVCLASGWLPWQVRRALATGDPAQPRTASVLTATTGRCHISAGTRAWPAWIIEGLRTHPENQVTPGPGGQPSTAVQTNTRQRG